MRYHPTFAKLCDCFSRLPGVGRRSAERLAFGLATARDNLLADFAATLQEAAAQLCCCRTCGALTTHAEDPCRLCTDPGRDDSLLCVVESPADIMRIERAGVYRGRYHALMGRLSPSEGLGAKELRVNALLERIAGGCFREVILALNSNLESDATAGFLRSRLATFDQLRITRPAVGIPAGSGIEYADQVTLADAMQMRQPFA